MAFDRNEFLANVTERAQERNAALMPALRQLQAVAPVMQTLLTGSDAWDRYLTYLQGYIEQAGAAKVRAQAKMSDPMVWDAHDLTKLKSDILIADAMIDAWKAAIELPRSLINGATEASKTISRFEEAKNETAGQTQS